MFNQVVRCSIMFAVVTASCLARSGPMPDIGMVHILMRWSSSASIRMSLLAAIRGDGPGAESRRRARRRQRTKGYQVSQRIRKRIEEVFGWCKTVGGLARSRFVGRWKLKQQGEVAVAAYNLLRMARLAPMV